MSVAIIVHGGAGKWRKEPLLKAREVVEQAADAGLAILKRGGSSRDAVETAIRFMEDSGCLDAGKGSIAQMDGKLRMDASIMDSNLNCGAVAAIEDIQNPISVARKVMEKTDHVLMVGPCATDFATKNGFKRIKLKPKYLFKDGKILEASTRKAVACDTVGAVAVDKKGIITAGNSTGGRFGKMLPGRVGDVPIIGAGLYVNELAGVASTGIGEAFIKTCASKRAADLIERGQEMQKTAEQCIRFVLEKTGARGGMILLDRKGRHAAYYSTQDMPWAFRKE